MKKLLGCLGIGFGLLVVIGIIGAVIGINSDRGEGDAVQTEEAVSTDRGEASPAKKKAEPKTETVVDAAEIQGKRDAVIGKTFATLTVGEKQFSNATVESINDEGIKLKHDSGLASLLWDQVPEQVQEQWGYDAAAFQKALAAREKAQEAAAKQREEMAAAAQKQQEEAEKRQSEAKQAEIDEEFMQSSLKAGWVVHIEKANPGLNQFHVRLPAEKYTTKENVEKIAEFIARSFVMQSQNKGGTATSATIHVWEGDKVLVRGAYRK
jgi:hypothetical protein